MKIVCIQTSLSIIKDFGTQPGSFVYLLSMAVRAAAAELSNCGGGRPACKPKMFIIWSFQKRFANT